VGLNSLLLSKAQHMKYLIEMGGEMAESRFNPKTFDYDTMKKFVGLTHLIKLVL
jgi:hypothetical protein